MGRIVESSDQRDLNTSRQGWLAFHAPSHQVEALLHTTYHEYQDVETGGVLPSCERYHVPATIQRHIDFIHPGVRLLAPRTDPHGKKTKKRAIGSISTRFSHETSHGLPKEPSATSLKTCDEAITPACIAALYQIPEAHSATPNNSMGLFESELQFWNQEMLNIFFSMSCPLYLMYVAYHRSLVGKFSPRVPNGTHPRDYDIDGGVARTYNNSLAGGESIDLELVGLRIFSVIRIALRTYEYRDPGIPDYLSAGNHNFQRGRLTLPGMAE